MLKSFTKSKIKLETLETCTAIFRHLHKPTFFASPTSYEVLCLLVINFSRLDTGYSMQTDVTNAPKNDKTVVPRNMMIYKNKKIIVKKNIIE